MLLPSLPQTETVRYVDYGNVPDGFFIIFELREKKIEKKIKLLHNKCNERHKKCINEVKGQRR